MSNEQYTFKIFINIIFVNSLFYPSQNSDHTPKAPKLRIDEWNVFDNDGTGN